MVLELIGQPHFDLKRNVWNKCLINCVIIDSLSSNFKDTTTHLSMQHCFHMFVFYIIGTQYLHVRHPGEKKVLQNLYLTVIFHIIIKCGAHAQNSKSPSSFSSAVYESMLYLNKLWKHFYFYFYKESFLIVVSSWNRDLIWC